MATGGYVQYGGQGNAAGPALGYGDGAPYSNSGYRNYNDRYDESTHLPSASSPTKQKQKFDYNSLLYMPATKWTWAFSLTIILQLIVCLTLESIIFGDFQNELVPEAKNPDAADHAYAARTIPTYLSLLILGFVYELVLTYDALRTQNTIQVIGLVVMNGGILIYTAIQPDQIHDAVKNLAANSFINYNTYWTKASPILTSIPCLVALFTFILGIVSWKLYKEFGWKIYKQIGADRRMKNRYLLYQIYIAVLKFDFFLFIGFAIQFLVIVQGTNDAERDLTYAALPVFVILLLLAAWSVRHENIPTTIVSMIVYLVAFAYFLFKLVRMYDSPEPRLSQYAPARKTLTVFAVVTLIYLVLTMVIATWCALNYNKGLKQHILRRHRSGSVGTDGGSYEGKESSQYPLDPYRAPGSGGSGPGVGRINGGTRMEID